MGLPAHGPEMLTVTLVEKRGGIYMKRLEVELEPKPAFSEPDASSQYDRFDEFMALS